jgi:DNA polymerase I-like protein with 3'-5' exonuclease and polymerase domains
MLSPAHTQYLLDAAITHTVIEACGAETITDANGREGISFLYRGPETDSRQFRPDNPGPGPKYVFSKGETNFVNIVRESDGDTLLIVEGTKQALAAASHAPADVAVIGLAGCTMWHRHDWEVADGRNVLVCFDGDAATNRDVYNQAVKFGRELKDEGARSVSFIQVPDGAGIDDHLASYAESRRAREVAKLIRRAAAKPADAAPAPRKRKPSEEEPTLPETGDRIMVAVNGDLRDVTTNILGALKARWDGHYLFNYGRALTCVEGPSTLPLEEGDFLRLLADTVYMVTRKDATAREPERYLPGGRVDSHTLKALLSAARDFTELSRVVRAPFIRPDGTVCTTPGYDEATKTVLVDDETLSGITVPETPTEAETAAAVALLMDEWLGDMPLPDEGARANALALLITPFVRGMFELAPMAVVNGLQMGVGKNLFADCAAILATGKPAVPMPYTSGNDEETKKLITSAFRSGSELFVFDEAHRIEGPALARALTSITYTDRILGSSVVAEFPNQVTWMALGNQVQVNGDVSRRVYWIELRPRGANPQDRDASSFRHPDLRAWTTENRPRLVQAMLTVIRSWFAAGKPTSSRGATLGSFEGWDRIVGGIVAHAGLKGFLSEIKEKRSETDVESAYWTAHINWLWETFADERFTTAQVRDAALAKPREYEAPPRMEDPSEKSYTRELGKAYSSKKERWYDGMRLIKDGLGHRSTIRWTVENPGNPTPFDPSDGGDGGNGGNPTTHAHGKNTSLRGLPQGDVCTHVGRSGQHPSDPSVTSIADVPPSPLPFDLETCSVKELYRRGDFVRLGGYGDTVAASIEEAVAALNAAPSITGHNALAFDLIALARHHGADYEALAAKCVDTWLVGIHRDPIPAKEKLPAGYHTLDGMAKRLGVTGKTDDVKRLARKYGGFDRIPLDVLDPYLRGDLNAQAAVYEAVKDVAADEYVKREHRVQTAMGRITLNGFRVDEELVWDRYQRGQDRLDVIKDRLHRVHGFPATGSAPQRSSAGKAAFLQALMASGLGPKWIESNWPKNKDGSLSLSKDVLTEKREFLREPKPAASELCDAILDMNGVRSIYGNIIDNMVDGRVHPSIMPFQASGRWSIQDPGVTVTGKRGGKHIERAVYVAEEGEVLVAFDLDQIDPRSIAAASQDPDYIELFIPRPGKKIDPHQDVADKVGLTRDAAKAISNGWMYGLGIAGQERNGVPRELAERFDTGMREAFPRLVQWQNEVREEAGALPYGEMPPAGDEYRTLYNLYGRPMRVHRTRAYTQAPALIGQGTTRDVIAEGILRMPFEVRCMIKAVIHDEVVLSIPVDAVEEVSRIVIDALTFELRGVPITSGASPAGTSWDLCYAT